MGGLRASSLLFFRYYPINLKHMIRFAESGDVNAIMNLLHQVNDVHADGRPDLFIHGHTKYSSSEIIGLINNPDYRIFVYSDEDGEVKGHAFCIIQDHTSDPHLAKIRTLYIDDICVDSDCRGLHIGESIYQAVKKYAQEEAFHNITLNVWSCNESALRFYEKMGLRPYKSGMEEILDSIS